MVIKRVKNKFLGNLYDSIIVAGDGEPLTIQRRVAFLSRTVLGLNDLYVSKRLLIIAQCLLVFEVSKLGAIKWIYWRFLLLYIDRAYYNRSSTNKQK